MEHLKNIKDTLVSLVETELTDVKHTNTCELGQVIDMIKDIEKAMYYCSIVKAMEEYEEAPEAKIAYYVDRPYMDKKMHHTNLEHYMNEIKDDVTDMIKESTPEEKKVISTKLQQLATSVKE